MRHYGAQPPWSGEPRFGLRWVRLPGETWEGDPVWELQDAPPPLVRLSEILKEVYLPRLQEILG